MALKRFTAPSLDNSAIALLPSRNPIISYIEYPNNATSASSAGGQTIIIHGYNFRAGVSVYIGATLVPTVTLLDGSRIRFTSTTINRASASYDLYVINSDGTGALFPPKYQISSVGPTWVTPAGSLGQVDEFLYNFTVAATSDSQVTYSLVSGSLPVGYTLTSSNGRIAGSHNIPAQASIVYTFTIRATDLESQYSDRTFSITFIPTYPTWITTTALPSGRVGQFYSTDLVAVSDSVVTYTAGGSLPPGLNLNTLSGIISGTPTSAVNTTIVINAIDNQNNVTQKIFSIVIV